MNSLFRTLTFLITAFVLSACEKPPEKADVERAQLVKMVPVAAQMLSGQRDFPATIKAHQRADLSFRVSGKVEQINFNDGSAVKKGQVIARLDARDYKTMKVNDPNPCTYIYIYIYIPSIYVYIYI